MNTDCSQDILDPLPLAVMRPIQVEGGCCWNHLVVLGLAPLHSSVSDSEVSAADVVSGCNISFLLIIDSVPPLLLLSPDGSVPVPAVSLCSPSPWQ